MKPLVNVTIPVFNEEAQLPRCVERLTAFLRARCRFDYEIVIVDSGSHDTTLAIARQLAARYPIARVIHLQEKGRGRALKAAWQESAADVLSYMDVDLSTDLRSFPTLIEALLSGGYDVACGSRLLKSSQTTRGLKRELLSRGYNLLVRGMFRPRFSDAQCGFKAITRSVLKRVFPLVRDNAWFMDTEMLVLADSLGYRICDIPVRWVDDTDSRVEILPTIWEDLNGLVRLRRSLNSEAYLLVRRQQIDSGFRPFKAAGIRPAVARGDSLTQAAKENTGSRSGLEIEQLSSATRDRAIDRLQSASDHGRV